MRRAFGFGIVAILLLLGGVVAIAQFSRTPRLGLWLSSEQRQNDNLLKLDEIVGGLRDTDIEFPATRFGAVCDGVTDDAAAIQGALNTAALVGGTVTIPPRTCLVGTGLTLASVELRGSGSGSRLQAKAGLAASLLTLSGVRSSVADLRLFMSLANTQTAITVADDSAAFTHLHNLRITYAGDNNGGTAIDNRGHMTTIAKVWIELPGTGILSTVTEGFDADPTDRDAPLTITDTYIEAPDTVGIWILAGGDAEITGVHLPIYLARIRIENPYGGSFIPTNGILISGSDAIGVDLPIHLHQISIDNINGGAALAISNVDDVVVSGSRLRTTDTFAGVLITNTARTTIATTTIDSPSADIQLSGSTITHLHLNGLRLLGTAIGILSGGGTTVTAPLFEGITTAATTPVSAPSNASGSVLKREMSRARHTETALTTSNVSITAGSGSWGTTATRAVTGTDSGFTVTVTAAGSGFSANPRVRVTFVEGTSLTTPEATCVMDEASTGTLASLTVTTTTAQVDIDYNGTPSANTYIFKCSVVAF